jgi:hypothetical protein
MLRQGSSTFLPPLSKEISLRRRNGYEQWLTGEGQLIRHTGFFFFFFLFLLSCFSFPEFCKYLRVWVAFWPPVPKIMVPKCQCKNQINNHRLLNSQNNPCSLPRRVWADNWARGGSAVKINLCNPALGKISLVFRSQGKGLHNPAFPSVTVLTAVTSTGLMIKPSRQNHKDRPCPLPSVSTEKSNLEKRIYR